MRTFVSVCLSLLLLPSLLAQEITHQLAITLSVDGKPLGDLEVGLFGNLVPKTVENFRSLCLGAGKNEEGVELTYKGTRFHKIVPKFMAFGGDIVNGDGTGGVSIYGPKFDDESLETKPFKGCLIMDNKGSNSNTSKFAILFSNVKPHERKVVFGQVLNMEFLRDIEKYGDYSGRPKKEVKIEDCREVTVGKVGSQEVIADEL